MRTGLPCYQSMVCTAHPAPDKLTVSYCRGMLAAVLASLVWLAACDSTGEHQAHSRKADQGRDAGYEILRTLLADERHIETLRLLKTVVNLRNTTDPTNLLIDDIAAASAANLEQIEQLAGLEPPVILGESRPDQIDQAVIDTLRMTTARNLVLASRDDFELMLVVSQVQALRLISQLSGELRNIDPNTRRQTWLEGLAVQYEDLYQRAVARLSLAAE
jgi:hypothetical protein